MSQVTGYDALGNRLSSTNPEKHTASFVYDSLNRLQTTTSAAGVEMTQVHNAAGWVMRDGGENGRLASLNSKISRPAECGLGVERLG